MTTKDTSASTSSERVCISRNRYYNPKVHVAGWYDIQQDDDYIEKYQKMKEIGLNEYPTTHTPKRTTGKKLLDGAKTYQTSKDLIFYQNHGTDTWVTENKASYTRNGLQL